jgi:hypothetical protein
LSALSDRDDAQKGRRPCDPRFTNGWIISSLDRQRRLVVIVSLLCAAGLVAPATAATRDSDGDGMPNRWEVANHLDPHRRNARGNPDHDGLVNIQEYFFHGDPHRRDTDRDGLGDGHEVNTFHTQVNVPDAIVGKAVGTLQCPSQSSDDPACNPFRMFAVTITLEDETGTEIAHSSTDPAGRFSFQWSQTGAGSYDLRAVPATGFTEPPIRNVTVARGDPPKATLRYRNSAGPGVAGQVTESPTCPVERPGEVCERPLQGARLDVKDMRGAVVASTLSAADGRYAISLSPGSYTLVAEPMSSTFPVPPPPVDFTVELTDTGPNHIDLDYDTGIR